MVLDRPTSPRALRQANRDQSGCPRRLPQIPLGWRTPSVPAKAPGIEIAASIGGSFTALGQSEVDNLRCHSVFLLQANHKLVGFMSRCTAGPR